MSVIAKAIADRQSEIERLQAEIKALNDVDKILGASAPAKPAARRSSSQRTATVATPVAETASDATPTRKRRPMTAKEKEAVCAQKESREVARRRPPAALRGNRVHPRIRGFSGVFGATAGEARALAHSSATRNRCSLGSDNPLLTSPSGGQKGTPPAQTQGLIRVPRGPGLCWRSVPHVKATPKPQRCVRPVPATDAGRRTANRNR